MSRCPCAPPQVRRLRALRSPLARFLSPKTAAAAAFQSLIFSNITKHCVLGGFKQFLVKNEPLDRRKGSTGPPPETHRPTAAGQQHRSYTGLYLTIPNPVICKELKCFLRRQKMGSAGLSPHHDAFRPSAGPAAEAFSHLCRIPVRCTGFIYLSPHGTNAPIF